MYFKLSLLYWQRLSSASFHSLINKWINMNWQDVQWQRTVIGEIVKTHWINTISSRRWRRITYIEGCTEVVRAKVENKKKHNFDCSSSLHDDLYGMTYNVNFFFRQLFDDSHRTPSHNLFFCVFALFLQRTMWQRVGKSIHTSREDFSCEIFSFQSPLMKTTSQLSNRCQSYLFHHWDWEVSGQVEEENLVELT